MSKFTFVPYSIRIRVKRKDQYLRLGISDPDSKQLINSEEVDFLSIFEGFVSQLPHAGKSAEELDSGATGESEEKSESELKLEKFLEEEKDLEEEEEEKEEEKIILRDVFAREKHTEDIKGILFAGDIEESSAVYDPNTNFRLYTIDKGLATARPFYFRVKASKHSDKGILVLQTFKKYGIKDVFVREFSRYVKEHHDEMMVEINSFVPKRIIEYYLSQRVVEVQLIKFGFPDEIMDRDPDSIPEEEAQTVKGKSIMLFKPDRGENLPSRLINKLKGGIKELGCSNGQIRNLVEVQSFDYENVKIKVKIGDSVRTINLAKQDSLRYNEELDGQLEIDEKTGHPTFDSIDTVGQKFAADCAEEVWGGQLNDQILEET